MSKHRCANCGESFIIDFPRQCPGCSLLYCDNCLIDGLCEECYDAVHPEQREAAEEAPK